MSNPSKKRRSVRSKNSEENLMRKEDDVDQYQKLILDNVERKLNWHIRHLKKIESVRQLQEMSYSLYRFDEPKERLIMLMKKFIFVQVDLLNRPPPSSWGFDD